MLAVIVRLAVTAIGNPSGIKAMATLTQLTMSAGTEIQPGWFLRRYAALTKVSRGLPSWICENSPDNNKRDYHRHHDGDNDKDKVENFLL